MRDFTVGLKVARNIYRLLLRSNVWQKMIFITKYDPHEIAAILQEQIDDIPSYMDALGMKIRGTSAVCGTVNDSGFELRNRHTPMYSIRAYGEFITIEEGTLINISFKKPNFLNYFWNVIFNRNKTDREIIINFLKEWIKIKDTAEQTSSQRLGE